MIRRPPISTRTDTLFPYTTLFRSASYVCSTTLIRGAKRATSLTLSILCAQRPLACISCPRSTAHGAPPFGNATAHSAASCDARITCEIGRASCRERVCLRVDLGGRGIIKKKKEKNNIVIEHSQR